MRIFGLICAVRSRCRRLISSAHALVSLHLLSGQEFLFVMPLNVSTLLYYRTVLIKALRSFVPISSVAEDGSQPNELNDAVIGVVDQASCANTYSFVSTITDGWVCASGQGRDACQVSFRHLFTKSVFSSTHRATVEVHSLPTRMGTSCKRVWSLSASAARALSTPASTRTCRNSCRGFARRPA